MSTQVEWNPITTAALRELRKSVAALLLELPEAVWRGHKGVVEMAISQMVEDQLALRSALIYLADGVADEVQPHDDSPLGRHLRNARAALRGDPLPPAGTLADGHLWPTDLADGATEETT